MSEPHSASHDTAQDVARQHPLDLLRPGETVLWHGRPRRHPWGRGLDVSGVFGAALLYACIRAALDVPWPPPASVLLPALPWLVLTAVALWLTAYPVVARVLLGRQRFAITTERALWLTRTRGTTTLKRALPVTACDAGITMRPRGNTRTLILTEAFVERPADGRIVHRWQAFHGLRDAEGAQAALRRARGDQEKT